MYKLACIILLISGITSLEPNACTVENCVECPSSDDKCEKCKSEYYLKDNTCDDCAINCQTCHGGLSNECDLCNDLYAFDYGGLCLKVGISKCLKTNENASKCIRCIDGASFSDDGKSCIGKPCPNGCGKCKNDGDTCTQCYEGFFLTGTKCKACFENCRECTSDAQKDCTYCTYNYGFNKEHKCIKVGGGNCFMADAEGKSCASCIPGYHLDTKTKKCEVGSAPGSGSYLKLGLLAVLVLLF